jgi:hypothetical protein
MQRPECLIVPLVIAIFPIFIAARCPWGQQEFPFNSGDCYGLSQTIKSFYEADVDCRGGGGNLTSVHSTFEANFLQSLNKLYVLKHGNTLLHKLLYSLVKVKDYPNIKFEQQKFLTA